MLIYMIMALTLKLSNEVRFSVVLVAAETQCHDIILVYDTMSTIASYTPNIAHYNNM